jgi:hypothetical protein
MDERMTATRFSWDDMLERCPHRAVLHNQGAEGLNWPMPEAHFDAAYAVIDAFTDGMRKELIRRLSYGETLLVMTNGSALLWRVLDQIALDLAPPAGTA